MRLVPINEAEAMLETFWDGGSSEHPDDKPDYLRGYAIELPLSAICSVGQIWCALKVTFDSGQPGSSITMTIHCDIDISGYDVFRIFASVPSWVSVSASGTIDGREVAIIKPITGADTNDEIDGPISGAILNSLTVSYTLLQDRSASLNVLWFGLSNKKRQKLMESWQSPYSAEWPGLLQSSEDYSKASNKFLPDLDIMFGGKELDLIRESLHDGHLKDSYDALLQQATSYLSWEPEHDIGVHIPNPDRRWVRNRDMRRRNTAGVMQTLAFAGIVEGSYEMLRMAARMALSAAHCEYWCESIIGTMPGVTWHHRSFTEEVYCRACALVLDWAGSILTPPAKQLIRDAIVMKGLPRIESDFKRMEYIRSMNQGIVFSSGRIFAALALVGTHPRYSTLIDEAEQDLHAMIDTYVKKDGGVLEGMAYWSYTFSTAMPVFYALSRHRGVSLSEYATDVLRKTSDFGLGMLSTTGNGSTYLPINDAHADYTYPLGLIAAYARLSHRNEWNVLYHAALKNTAATPDIYHFILAPRDSASVEDGSLLSPRFDVFPDVGQMSSVRMMESGEVSQIHLCSGPADGGHYHDDKGSIIVIAGGEPLAYDRGVTDYHHPEVNLIGIAARHNLLYPEEHTTGNATKLRGAAGAKLVSAEMTDSMVVACSDNTTAWEPGLFVKNLRRIFSPHSDFIVIDDEIQLNEPLAMSFRMNSPYPIKSADGCSTIIGERYSLIISPINYKASEIIIDNEGVDSHLHPVQLLKICTESGMEHRLLTALIIVPNGQTQDLEPSYGDGLYSVIHKDTSFSFDVRAANTLLVQAINATGNIMSQSRCDGGVWTVK